MVSRETLEVDITNALNYELVQRHYATERSLVFSGHPNPEIVATARQTVVAAIDNPNANPIEWHRDALNYMRMNYGDSLEIFIDSSSPEYLYERCKRDYFHGAQVGAYVADGIINRKVQEERV